MVAIMLGADNGFFYAGQVMHFSSPFTVFLIYHKHTIGILFAITIVRIPLDLIYLPSERKRYGIEKKQNK